MCYSALFEQDFKKYVRKYGALVDYAGFEKMMLQRLIDSGIRIPRAMEANFLAPKTPVEKRIKQAIDEFRARLGKEYEEGMFSQRTRLNDAERALKVRETKKALNDKRVATNKVSWFREKLADLKRTELESSDSRIFPFWYAPVMVMEDGNYVLKPMRYHCRPQGKPEFYDKKFDGLYNARRDSLERFWKELFGTHHALAIVTSFYENVALHDFERRPLRTGEKPRNVVLHFNPTPKVEMQLACLWSHWSAPGKEDLLSFAAITDEPPPEIAAAGHDRCVIPLKQENLAAWINPADKSKAELQAILDDRERPYYEHRLAA